MNAKSTSMKRRIGRRTGLLAVGLALAACSATNDGKRAESTEVSPNVPATAAQAPKDPRVEAWEKVIRKTPPPKDGCFRTAYPSTAWTEVPCEPAPVGPSTSRPPRMRTEQEASESPTAERPGEKVLPGQGGSGSDWTLQESGPITQATGKFATVTGGTGTTSYSVQLNTNPFQRTATSDSRLASYCPAGSCNVWQQVLYSTTAKQTGVYFQYWVLSGGNCPYLELFDGWSAGKQGGTCYLNSGSISGVPVVTTNALQGMAVTVTAGSSDVIIMTVNGGAYSASFPSELGLNQGSWKQVEYGVLGDLGSSAVTLGPDTTITTQITAEPYTNTASCSNVSFTAETNNLFDPTGTGSAAANCCLPINSYESGITFTETNTPGQACTVCGGVGQLCCGGNTPSWCAAGNVCYGGTCNACGGNGELCCASNTCTTPGVTCQDNYCGTPNLLTANPNGFSVAASDGSGPSVNYANIQFTASGAWAGSAPLVLTASSQPPGMSCVQTIELAPTSGPSTMKCTASYNTPTGAYDINVTGTSGAYSVTATVPVQVTGCQTLTCSEAGYVCGSIDNGCGGTVSCGSCPSGETCTGGSCFGCAQRSCPPPEFFNPNTCECQSCPCGTIYENGHYICNVCRL